ncbi:jmjC domain-containing protein 8 isoform X2 [Emys orbicularis]|uniref:jmjC domain-containing protein 8 isoform X2 n=1 Tax=Emys orbicularis TaxID=82168 RepID=UPI0031FCB661
MAEGCWRQMGSWWQFLLLYIPLSLPGDLDYLEGNGGWPTNKYLALMEEDHCTVERRDASLTYSQFIDQYAFSRPVVIQGITDNSEFQALCTRNKLLAEFGDRLVRLSTANTYSYRKVDVPFQEYVEHLLEPQDLASLGSETLYFFGDNNFTEWGSLFQKYMPPPFRIPGTSGAYSFGIAALVSLSPRENPRVPPQQDNSSLAAGRIPISAAGGPPCGVHHSPWRGAVFP